MTIAYDFASYGKFKSVPASKAKSLARKAGFRSRYLRFFAGVRSPIVELGCGDGSFIEELRRAGFSNVAGVDISPTYRQHQDVQIGAADAFLAIQADRSIGCIVAFDLFEHIPLVELRALLALAREKLARDGKLIFRVPNMASPLALPIYFGDLSHTTPLSECAVRHLAFENGLEVEGIYPEPLSYPRSLVTLAGYLLWPLYRAATKAVLAAFGQRPRVLTPNLIAVLRHPTVHPIR